MTLVIGAFTIGLILSLLSMGVWLAFRVLRFCDITVDGSITLGASVAAVLLVKGWSPWTATLAATGAGVAAGLVTGTLHTRFRIQEILSGILVMTALYSVNLRIMGKSNVPLLDVDTVATPLAGLLSRAMGGADAMAVAGWPVPINDAAMLLTVLIITVVVGVVIRFYMLTHAGTAMRASGENPQMVRAQGVNNNTMLVLGLAAANGLVAMAGALLAQYQGFADVQMGIGMIVLGIASVIIGEALVRDSGLGLTIVGAVMGAVLFRLLVAVALRWGLNPNDLKLVTAAFVFVALVVPRIPGKFRKQAAGVSNA